MRWFILFCFTLAAAVVNQWRLDKATAELDELMSHDVRSCVADPVWAPPNSVCIIECRRP